MTKLTAAQYMYASEHVRELVECLEEAQDTLAFLENHVHLAGWHERVQADVAKYGTLLTRIRAAEGKAKCSIITAQERAAS